MRPVTRQVFAALRAEQQKLVSQRLGFGTDLQTWVDELLSTACAGALSAEALLPLLQKRGLVRLR